MGSAIILCQPSQSGYLKDEVTAQALVDLNLDLKLDLFAIPGCESSYAYSESGVNELLGILRAVLQSGVRTFLVANWKIDNEASVAFLKAFIEHYQKHNSKVGALQYAQKLFIESKMNPIYQHPYFWGGFRLVYLTTPKSKLEYYS